MILRALRRTSGFTRTIATTRDILVDFQTGKVSLDEVEELLAGSRKKSATLEERTLLKISARYAVDSEIRCESSLLSHYFPGTTLVTNKPVTETVGGYARIDHGRAQRTGLPEVVFGEGKSDEHLRGILKVMHEDALQRGAGTASNSTPGPSSPGPGSGRGGTIVAMATRVSPSQFAAVSPGLPTLRYYGAARIAALHYDDASASLCKSGGDQSSEGADSAAQQHDVAVLCAGTSDFAVAEEAAVTLDLFGLKVARLYDVGVAGLHRLLVHMPVVRNSKVAICVAGMDGALPSVVGGLAKCPVVAVPTSVGYGAAMKGVAPLLTMLNSCSPGVSVVNIDNGFGAAMVAVKMLQISVDGDEVKK